MCRCPAAVSCAGVLRHYTHCLSLTIGTLAGLETTVLGQILRVVSANTEAVCVSSNFKPVRFIFRQPPLDHWLYVCMYVCLQSWGLFTICSDIRESQWIDWTIGVMTWQRATPTEEDASIKKWRTRTIHDTALPTHTGNNPSIHLIYRQTAMAQFKSYTHYVNGM